MMRRPVRLSLFALEHRLTPAVGDLDTRFGGDGFVEPAAADAVFADAAGRVTLAGRTFDGPDQFVLQRLLPDGAPDPSFGGGDGVVPVDAQALGRPAAFDAQGRLLLVSLSGSTLNRLTPAGEPDPAFAGDGGAEVDLPGDFDTIRRVTTDRAGNVLLTVTTEPPSAATDPFGRDAVWVVRLTPEGLPDAGFSADGVADGGLTTDIGPAAFADKLGRVYLGASRSPSAAGLEPGPDAELSDVTRFTASGEFDAAYAGDGSLGFPFGERVLTVDALGRVVTSRFRFTDQIAGTGATTLQRYSAAGEVDPGFAPDLGLGDSGTVLAAGADAAGRVPLVLSRAGSDAFSRSTRSVVRLTAAGTLDESFGETPLPSGLVGSQSFNPTTVTVGRDGDIFVSRGAVNFSGPRGQGISQRAGIARVDGGAAVASGPFAVGAAGRAALVNADGVAARTFDPFPGFTGSVRVVAADFTGDGVADLAAATGPGAKPEFVVYDGATGAELFRGLAFEESFLGGVNLAAGDLDGDGRADIVLAPDEGGGPRVKVLSGADLGRVLADFFGIDDANFRGGARAAVGDFNGDGANDLAVAAGFGGGPRVALFDGTSRADGRFARKLGNDFFLFEETLRNGAYLAAGDADDDGRDDLFTGGGPGGGPRVQVRSAGGPTVLANFFAGPEAERGGVPLAARDLDGDGLADAVAGVGGRAKAFSLSGGAPKALADAAPLGDIAGIFVG